MSDVKVLDLSSSVFELCSQYPELIDFMKDLGFTDIVKPGMLNTAGRFMTIPKGARMKGLDLGEITRQLEKAGFTIKMT